MSHDHILSTTTYQKQTLNAMYAFLNTIITDSITLYHWSTYISLLVIILAISVLSLA